MKTFDKKTHAKKLRKTALRLCEKYGFEVFPVGSSRTVSLLLQASKKERGEFSRMLKEPVRGNGSWKKYASKNPKVVSQMNWTKASGVGVVIPKKFLVVDFDTLFLPKRCELLPSTLTVETPNGFHLYYRGSKAEVKTFLGGRSASKAVVNGCHIGELKSFGGYVLAPNSIGVNKSTNKLTKYKLANDCEPFVGLDRVFKVFRKPKQLSAKDRQRYEDSVYAKINKVATVQMFSEACKQPLTLGTNPCPLGGHSGNGKEFSLFKGRDGSVLAKPHCGKHFEYRTLNFAQFLTLFSGRDHKSLHQINTTLTEHGFDDEKVTILREENKLASRIVAHKTRKQA